MKKLFILLFLVTMMTSLSAQCYKVDTVTSIASVTEIGGRPIIFGAQTTLEEIASSKYQLCNEGSPISGTIKSIAMPEELLNIVGLQFLKRDYIVITEINLNGVIVLGEAKKTVYVNAMFVSVEGIPHNRKAYSKALEKSFKNGFENLK
jgi:hypothetical protein